MTVRPIDDAAPQTDGDDFIVADTDYFATKARQCFRLARKAHDGIDEETLESLGFAFEAKARALKTQD